MHTTALASSLRSAVSALHKGLRKHMPSAGQYSMTEMETIGHLHRSGTLLPSELAALTRVTNQSMSQILAKMDKTGIIKRIPDKEDGRKVLVSLTPFGKKMVEQTRYERDEWLREIIERTLSEREKERLLKLLPLLIRLGEAI